MGHLDVYPCAGGGWAGHTGSFSWTEWLCCLSTQTLSVCPTSWGTWTLAQELAVGSGWPQGQHSHPPPHSPPHSQPPRPTYPATVCRFWSELAHPASSLYPSPNHPPFSRCPRDPMATTKVLLYFFLSEHFLLQLELKSSRLRGG